MRDATLRNYESWLRPFVRWLDDGVRQGRLDVTDHVLKTYLDERYRSGEYESYMRVGNQIATFLNRYLADKVRVIPPLSYKRNKENVQMPLRTLRKLIIECKKNLTALRKKPRTNLVIQQTTKYLGKCCNINVHLSYTFSLI